MKSNYYKSNYLQQITSMHSFSQMIIEWLAIPKLCLVAVYK